MHTHVMNILRLSLPPEIVIATALHRTRKSYDVILNAINFYFYSFSGNRDNFDFLLIRNDKEVINVILISFPFVSSTRVFGVA